MVSRIRLSESPRPSIDEELAAAVEMARRVDEQFNALGLEVQVEVYRDEGGHLRYAVSITSAPWDFDNEMHPELVLAALRLEVQDAGRALKAERDARVKAERKARVSA